MKKGIIGIIIAVVCINGFGAAVSSFSDQTIIHTSETVSFSTVQLIDEDDYVTVGLSEATSYLSTPGSIDLPVVTRVFTFPYLSNIADVKVSFSETQEQVVTKPLKRASEAIADNVAESPRDGPESASVDIYPEQPYSYHIGVGRNGATLATYVAVHLYPVQYLSFGNLLRCYGSAQITISAHTPETRPSMLSEQVDLVIIAPKAFSKSLQPLVTHKTSKDMTTKLVTCEDIYNSVDFPVEGRDCAEEIKYFIKNAFDQWNITYVLFVGGRNGGVAQEKWWVPVRYSQLNDGDEGSYLTDLYFADLYENNGTFSSWDSNNNGIFAEWTTMQKDILDMYPEVYVGRLACSNIFQVKTMVEKIISYETSTYGAEWFKTFIGIAGDTYPEPSDPYYEGELATNASYQQLESLGFEASMLWTSNGRLTGPDAVLAEMNLGCGFVHFSGHGNVVTWSTHPPRNDSAWVNGLQIQHMSKLANGEKQPIVIVGGCHNAQYNTSLANIIKGFLQDGLDFFKSTKPYGAFWQYEWIPRCWAWSLASQRKDGAIAVIANTGLGYGQPGETTLTERGRHMEWLFFKAYKDGHVNLGAAHSMDIIAYMNEHPPMEYLLDCKIAQEWALLGDPSLRIGGYPS